MLIKRDSCYAGNIVPYNGLNNGLKYIFRTPDIISISFYSLLLNLPQFKHHFFFLFIPSNFPVLSW